MSNVGPLAALLILLGGLAFMLGERAGAKKLLVGALALACAFPLVEELLHEVALFGHGHAGVLALGLVVAAFALIGRGGGRGGGDKTSLKQRVDSDHAH